MPDIKRYRFEQKYRAFHRFEQAKFACGDLVIGLSQFLLLPQLLQKMCDDFFFTFARDDVNVSKKDIFGLACFPRDISHVRLRVRIGGSPAQKFFAF